MRWPKRRASPSTAPAASEQGGAHESETERGGESLPLLAFNLEGVHPHDLATFLDEAGIALRTGHHCAQPALRALGLNATARASFGLYNLASEGEALAAAVREARNFFRHSPLSTHAAAR